MGQARHSIRRGKRNGGFTLTEVMVASMILTLFLGGFLTSVIMAMRTLDMSIHHYVASSIARNRIQRARSFDYDSLTLLEESETRIDRFGNTDASGTFRRSTSIDTNTVTAPYTVHIQVGVRFPVKPGNNLSQPLVVNNLIAARM